MIHLLLEKLLDSHLCQKRGVLDDGDHLGQHSGDNGAVALWEDDQPEGLGKLNPWE